MEDLQYKIEHKPSKEIYDLLRETVYGTKGVKIKHLDTDKKLLQLHNPDFHTLWQNDQLIGVAVYCRRNISIKKELVDAYYIRYFSIHASFQNKGYGQLLTRKIENYYKQNVKNKTVFYAYIEDKNLKSIGVSKHFQPQKIGTMKTLFFSRFFPKENNNCHTIETNEIPRIKSQIIEQNKELTGVWLDKVGYEKSYYVYKEKGEVVAGIQIINTKWSVPSLPGVMGWLTLNIFPFIPILNKIAEGNRLSFLGVEGIIYQENELDKLIFLLEHALADTKKSKAFIYLDEKDKLYTKLLKRNDLGFMRKVQNSPSVSIVQQSLLLSKNEEKILMEYPKYISAFDVT